MKKNIITIYLGIAIICCPFYWVWGEYSYVSGPYSMGAAFAWPISLFKSYPEIDGESPNQFMVSFLDVERSGRPQGHIDFYESIGYLSLFYYAEEDPSITGSDAIGMLSKPDTINKLFQAAVENPRIAEKVREALDGKTFGDVVRKKEDWKDDLFDLVGERRSTPSAKFDLSMDEKALRALYPENADLSSEQPLDD